LCALVGPLAQRNGEVYSAATDRNQAGIIYKMAAQMIRLDTELSQMCACHDSVKRIVCYHLGSFYQAISADAHRQHGANPHFVIYDELAQAPNRDLYDVLVTSFDAQPNALLLVISTQSADPQSIMTELCDDAIAQESGMLEDPYFYGKVFRVSDKADPWDEKEWYAANPALGDFKLLLGMRSQAEKAKRSPSAAAGFFNLQLNMRVDASASFVNSIDWRACEAFVTDAELAGLPAYGGLDLSGKRDLTSLVLLFRLADGRIAVRVWFWTPKENLEDRSKQDGARYVEWAAAGHMRAIEGRTIDYATVASDIAAIKQKYNIQQINFDRWRIDDLVAALNLAGVKTGTPKDEKLAEDALILCPHGQGWKDMSPAVDDLEQMILDHKLNHGANPVLTYCMANVRLTKDPADNRKFDKRQKNKRIDGAVALAMAASALNRTAAAERQGPSVYEQRGVLVF
jgi:phage terminase large subunit-like protein